MGNYPSFGSKGGTVIGSLELNICYDTPCCKCGSPWYNCNPCGACCPGVAPPKGPEWEKAKEGFEPFLAEAATTALKVGGCCMDVFKAKKALDGDWTDRANGYLGQHGLSVEVCAFYTSDGKSATPHLCLQFTKTA